MIKPMVKIWQLGLNKLNVSLLVSVGKREQIDLGRQNSRSVKKIIDEEKRASR